jgi:hypothetical protein
MDYVHRPKSLDSLNYYTFVSRYERVPLSKKEKELLESGQVSDEAMDAALDAQDAQHAQLMDDFIVDDDDAQLLDDVVVDDDDARLLDDVDVDVGVADDNDNANFADEEVKSDRDDEDDDGDSVVDVDADADGEAAAAALAGLISGNPEYLYFNRGHPLFLRQKLKKRHIPHVVINSGLRLPDKRCFSASDRTDLQMEAEEMDGMCKAYAQHVLVLFKPFRDPEDLYGPVPAADVSNATWIQAYEAFKATPECQENERYMEHSQDYYIASEAAAAKAMAIREQMNEVFGGSSDTRRDGDGAPLDDDFDNDEDEMEPDEYYSAAEQLMINAEYAVDDEMSCDPGMYFVLLAR